MNHWYANLLLDCRWLEKRRECLKLDKYTCQGCQKKYPEVTLCVHHLGYVNGFMPWDYPTYMLQTLCLGCHSKVHDGQKPIYFVCHRCGEIRPELEANGRDGKHQWICEGCIKQSLEQEYEQCN
jgi:hypothetical protein